MATHVITITGDVQDVGLRAQIVGIGRGQGRGGIVYNESDDVVRVIANGEAVEAFVDAIRSAAGNSRAEIDAIEARTLDVDVGLPAFSRVRTDDLGDVSDKLDVGIDLLDDILESNESIQRDTERLESIQRDTERLESIQRDTERLESIQRDTERLESIQRDTERLATIERNMEILVEQQSAFLDAIVDDS